jgi:hypothetical protein
MNEFESKPNVTSEDLAHKVLDRIDEEHVVPRPKWQFTIKDRLFWVFWILSVLLGSLLAATLVFVLVNSGWEYRVVTHQNFVWLCDAVSSDGLDRGFVCERCCSRMRISVTHRADTACHGRRSYRRRAY